MLLLLLLSRFSRVQLCATPETAAHEAPPSLGFSRQEHWSGLPFPSPMYESESESEVAQSCPTLSDPMDCSLPGSTVHAEFTPNVSPVVFLPLYGFLTPLPLSSFPRKRESAPAQPSPHPRGSHTPHAAGDSTVLARQPREHRVSPTLPSGPSISRERNREEHVWEDFRNSGSTKGRRLVATPAQDPTPQARPPTWR